MDRVNQILYHKQFLECVNQNEKWEQDRIFCKHGIEHFLDVARIAYIKVLERSMEVKKDVIYAAALLHDIGKYMQYEKGIPHEIGSAELAQSILVDCGYEALERDLITEMIRSHRTRPSEQTSPIVALFYEADKESRLCLFCQAREACHWSEKKKNLLCLL